MARQKRLREKEFLDELRAYADEQRRLVEAECDGFSPDHAARDQRASRARHDYKFFTKTYFPHYVKSEESVFHAWFFDNVPKLIDQPSGQFIEISAPRGEAKSTLGTQLFTLWCIVTGRKKFIPIVMDSFDQAATMLEAVKVELESNPRLAMDFPDACGAGRVWNAGVIVTRGNTKVQAFGSAKKMRGLRHGPHRPDLVMLDDIENDENVRSPEQRDKIEAWVKKVVLPLGPPDGTMDVLYLNTILHYDSVANRFHRNPLWKRVKFKAVIRWPDRMDLWQQWEELFVNEGEEASDAFYAERRAEMDLGAVVSWPGVRPLLKLMKIRASDHHAFDCEYQNDPTNDDASFFQGMTYWVQPSRDWVFYGSHDPSLGRNNRKRDPSATLVGGFDRNHGVLDIVEARVARRIPDLQISHVIEFQREYMCLAWAFEAVQFQEFLRTELVKRSAQAGVPVPAIPVHPHADKDLRIESLSPHVNNGLIRFKQEHTVLNSQLRHWPEADHDDGPDALHMLWALSVSRAGGISIPRIGNRK
ncbi:MAG: phage terminase large subunit [Pseudacidovorax sp.]|uniref:phage terminase large subunit n=1 Tax=Pseudacidovorax sp. TaxID=1934311 RepID=UPI001B42918E|nr:phage terminase large subunit [Pseudacidovorax sp.]MBP6897391.1 phage terminase large subunit [Pseudacidovorax sp.]